MNSTQYLIILITAVVCFCIYVLADIARMNRREQQMYRNAERQGLPSWAEYLERHNIHVDRNGYVTDDTILRLQEEIRTRLEGGDGA